MANFNPMQFAMNIIRSNPQLANNPQAKQIIDVIQSGDSQRGQQLAQNYCKTYGVSPEQGYQQAMSFFTKH